MIYMENVSFINDFYRDLYRHRESIGHIFVSTFVLFQYWNHESGRHCTQGCKASHTSGPDLFTTSLLLA